MVYVCAHFRVTCVTRGSLFFSSRRRHTRLQGDWSSDVFSSDLSSRSSAACPTSNRSRTRLRTRRYWARSRSGLPNALSIDRWIPETAARSDRWPGQESGSLAHGGGPPDTADFGSPKPGETVVLRATDGSESWDVPKRLQISRIAPGSRATRKLLKVRAAGQRSASGKLQPAEMALFPRHRTSPSAVHRHSSRETPFHENGLRLAMLDE